MSEIMPYIWIGIIVFASVAELHTLAFAAVCFIPAAFAAFILSLTDTVEIWLQVLIFFISAFILFILSRTVFRKLIKYKPIYNTSNADIISVIGKTAIVTEEINNYKNTGAISINGFTWTAQSEEDDIIYESGLVVTVIGAEGTQAICSR